MLLGSHRPTLDEKGRIVMPVGLRVGLDEMLFTVLGDDGQISLMAFEPYEDLRVKKVATALTGVEGRRALYRFQEFASQVKIDMQGRVALPENLREQCGLDRRDALTVIGMTTYVDIWSTARYRAFMGLD
jgi:MraZ protein